MKFKCSFSCVVVVMEERGLTLSQMSETFEQVDGRGGDHCYKLWILSYLDVWSSLHTCGSHIDALTRLKPVSSF